MSKKEIRKEYDRVRRNLKRRIKRAESKGFIYAQDIPAIPKRITQGSINRLSNLNTKFLKAGALFDAETGQLITSAKQYKEISRYNKARNLFTLEHGFNPEDYGATYNSQSNSFSIPQFDTEDYGVYEDVVTEKIGEVSELIKQINSAVLTQDWNNFLAGRSEQEAIEQLQSDCIYEKFQEALQVAFEYKSRNDGDDVGNNYMAGRAIVEASSLLREGAPLSAEDMMNIASAGYAP